MKNHNAKKALVLLFLLVAALLCSGCSDGGSKDAAATISEIPKVLNQAEYVLYQNVFQNDYGTQINGTMVSKSGVFAIIQDAFNNRTRYYVWGYLDNTLCCDWQWEFVPTNTKNLPAPGSLITVTGEFEQNEDALDNYWIKDANLTLDRQYTGPQFELNMQAMSDTLERVQLLNVMYRQESFEGKTFAAYGRIAASNNLEDPYYGAWQIPFSTLREGAVPAIGTNVVLTGKVTLGLLGEAQITVTD